MSLGVVHKLRWQNFGFFFDHLTPWDDIFYSTNASEKSGHFTTTSLPCFVNVVCERPLSSNRIYLYITDYILDYSRQTFSYGFLSCLRNLAEESKLYQKMTQISKFIKNCVSKKIAKTCSNMCNCMMNAL